MSRKRILIVGGVAGGSSCATRARRLDEQAEIVVFEKGPYVSFANCGLPYHVGDVIEEESKLLLVTPQRFQERFDIDVRVRHEVLGIDRERREVQVRDEATGAVHTERYDELVLATGARSFKPPIPGLDLPGVFALRTVPDTRQIREWITAHHVKRAVVLGAGFVGLEVAENLVRRGIDVALVEMQDQVLPMLDPEMAAPVASELRKHGVSVHTGEAVSRIEPHEDGLRVVTNAGSTLDAELVILGLGVRPRVELARDAGLTLGPRGGIQVDSRMQTSDPHIWAVGDAAEDRCVVTGAALLLPLAGPANRQGRLAADNICGREAHFRGVQRTAVCGVFDLTVASTGVSARELRRDGVDYWSTWLHPSDHVGYYPGAETIHLKLLYERGTGRVLGAQAVGRAGVEKRIDVIAMGIQMGATVFDLEQAELCYAPQFGAAKDPVNLAGMIGANHLRGDLPVAEWSELADQRVVLVDVREAHEFAGGHVPGAINLPLSELRDRLGELPNDRPIWLYCLSGKRSYDAARALEQRGFDVRTLPGGIESWRQLQGAAPVPAPLEA